MKKIYLSLLTLIFAQALNAQCTALTLYPSGAVTPTAAWTDVNACNYGGEYALVNVTAGNLYEFSTCAANGSTITFDTELTLRTNTGGLIAYSDDYCGIQSYVSWTATYTGQVQIHLHVFPCASNTICSNIRMKVTSSVPVPAPANNDCVNASNLTVNATCLLTSGTTSGATEDLIPDPSCDQGNINDVWYTFNSGPNTSVNVTVNLVTASWIGIEMFTACGTLATGLSMGGNVGNCDFNTSTPNPTLVTGLTPNTVYRFRLFTNITFDIAGSFTVCLTTPPPPPPPTVSINSASICPGTTTTLTASPSTLGGTYLWSPGGQTTQTITVSPLTTTNYSVTYTLNGVGTNNSTVTVFAPPAINAGLDITICSGAQATLSGTGGVSYSWNNGVTNNLAFNPLNTATYTVTGTDINGCTGTDQVTVTVNPNPTLSGNNVICPNTTSQLSGSGTAAANNAWVSSAAAVATVSNTGLVSALSFGSATITYTDNNGCSATTTINVSNPTAPTFNPVAAVCNGGAILLPIISNNGIQGTWSPALNNTQTTTYTFTPSAGQCATTGQVSVTVNPLPIVNAGIDQSTCDGGSVTLNGSGGVLYTWDNGVSDGVAFTPLATATYTVSTTDVNGCTNTDQVLVTVNPNPTVNGGNDQTVCVGGTATLSGSGASTYTWSGGVTNGVAFTPTVTNTYTVTGTSAAGCVGTDQVTINVTAGPVAAISGAAPMCLGNQVTLTASTVGVTYLWMPGGATTQTITVSPTSTTTYTLTVSLAGCGSSNDTQSVVVNPAPTANFTSEACETYTWFGSTYTQSGTYTHLVPSPAGCDSVLYLNLTIHNNVVGNTEVVAACDSYQWNGQTYNQSGIYTFNGLTIHDCDSSATIDLTINSAPIASITAIGNTLSTSQVAGETYAWLDCTTGSLIPNETSENYTPAISGSFAVIATNSCGIDTSDCENVVVGIDELANAGILVYPNPTNGVFTIYSTSELNGHLMVFDPRGKLILNQAVNKTINSVDLNAFSKGFYYLKLINNTQTINFSIVKN